MRERRKGKRGERERERESRERERRERGLLFLQVVQFLVLFLVPFLVQFRVLYFQFPRAISCALSPAISCAFSRALLSIFSCNFLVRLLQGYLAPPPPKKKGEKKQKTPVPVCTFCFNCCELAVGCFKTNQNQLKLLHLIMSPANSSTVQCMCHVVGGACEA